jgi:DNA-binding response OmpR family regulator
MARKIKLLLVEDEATLAGIIADTLNDRGFEVTIAGDGETGLRRFRTAQPDVVVTDIMMPCMDGFTFVEHLRRSGVRVPVLFLSARSSADDVVRGFETGGNDYLRKPFAISELVVRVKALLGRGGEEQDERERVFPIGSFAFDVSRGTLSGGGVCVELSARETELLARLVRRVGEIVPTRTLLLDIWGDDSYFNARSLHVFITKLRARLSADLSVSIVNARGVGYKLMVEGGPFSKTKL